MRITKPGDKKFLKALIFGPSGHGKTHLLGTAQADARTTPMLYMDFEGGEQTLSGLDIDMVTIRDWDDYTEVYNQLVEGKTPYKSIGVDSISETHIFALLSILDAEQANRRDANLLQQQDYGKATTQMRRLLRSFRDLPMHVFFTALARDIVEPKVGQVKVPALAGQLAEEIPGMMDVSGYLALTREKDSKTGEEYDARSLLLKGFSQFRVKIRTAWASEDVPDYLDNPSVTQLLDVLKFSYPVVQP